MSAQIKDGGAVDVLAELDALIVIRASRAAKDDAPLTAIGDLQRAEATCAAVAKLIERARALRSAHCAFQDWKAKAPKRYPAPRSILEMNAHAKAMLFAALDRVGGAQ